MADDNGLPIADIVGVYGAIVATAIGFYGWWTRRRPLHLALTTEFPDAGDDAEHSGDYGPPYVRLTVTNVGREPIALQGFGLRYRVEYQCIEDDDIGRMPVAPSRWGRTRLDMAESVHEEWLEDEVLGGLTNTRPPARLTGVWARDATGRMHRRQLGKQWRQLGYEGWGRSTQPPKVRPRYRAVILRAVVWLYRHAPGGTPIARLAHRLHLSPVATPKDG